MFKLISSSLNYNFLGQKKIAIVISAFLIIVSLTSFMTKGLNWGIDFSSGYIVQLNLKKKPTMHILESRIMQTPKGFLLHRMRRDLLYLQYFRTLKKLQRGLGE